MSGDTCSLGLTRGSASGLSPDSAVPSKINRPSGFDCKPFRVSAHSIRHTAAAAAAAAEQGVSMQGSFQGSGWQRWLEVTAAVEDCKLASHARRATLNLQSARTVTTAEVIRLHPQSCHTVVPSCPFLCVSSSRSSK